MKTGYVVYKLNRLGLYNPQKSEFESFQTREQAEAFVKEGYWAKCEIVEEPFDDDLWKEIGYNEE